MIELPLTSIQGLLRTIRGKGESLYSLLTWPMGEFFYPPEANKDKPDEAYNDYDRFIRKVVHLTDLHFLLTWSTTGRPCNYICHHVDTYKSYMDDLIPIKVRLEEEIESILNNYPNEFIDVP